MMTFHRQLAVAVLGAVLSCPSAASAGSEAEFYDLLFRKEIATVEDALRLLARYQGYAGPADLAGELAFLDQHNIRFRRDVLKLRDRPMTAGNAAHMMIQVSGLKGGVMAWIFPSNQRYALRQAVHLGLMPEDLSPEDPIRGRDLLGFVSKLAQTAKGVRR